MKMFLGIIGFLLLYYLVVMGAVSAFIEPGRSINLAGMNEVVAQANSLEASNRRIDSLIRMNDLRCAQILIIISANDNVGSKKISDQELQKLRSEYDNLQKGSKSISSLKRDLAMHQEMIQTGKRPSKAASVNISFMKYFGIPGIIILGLLYWGSGGFSSTNKATSQ